MPLPEVTSVQTGKVVHEWRVTGEPGKGYPSYVFTFRSDRDEWPGDKAEEAARHFIERAQDWTDGPNLEHRVVIYGDWEAT